MVNFLSEYAETQPRGLFAGLLAKQRKPVRDFFEPRFNELYNEYQGLLGQQATSGISPTMKFADFLGQQNLYNRYMAYSPQQRGIYNRVLQPPTRSLHFL